MVVSVVVYAHAIVTRFARDAIFTQNVSNEPFGHVRSHPFPDRHVNTAISEATVCTFV